MRARLGVVTIGQTPRPDLEAAFAVAAPMACIDVRGALDALAPDDARALADPHDPYPLLVRLRDGSVANVPMSVIHPMVERVAAALAHDGAYAVVVACAGDFPPVTLPIPVVIPGRILPDLVRAVTPDRHIGVVSPIEGQCAAAESKWRHDGFLPVMTHASPVVHEELDRAARTMRDAGVALVVLDCMGHDDQCTRHFAATAGCLVLSAQSAAVHVAATLTPPS
jgi:protein AroM